MTYSCADLIKMTVPQIKGLVRKHNLHKSIRGCSKLKKAGLIEAFMAKQPKPQGKRRIAPTLVTAKAGSKIAMTTTQRSSGLASYKSAL